MKSVMVAAIMALLTPAALACQGGSTQTLKLGDREIAKVEMYENRVKIVDSKSELFMVEHTPAGTEASRLICGSPNSGADICDRADQELDVDLTSEPDSTLVVGVLVDTHKEYYFKTSNFRVSRGSGCGASVEGSRERP